jgi:hypothetical protein
LVRARDFFLKTGSELLETPFTKMSFLLAMTLSFSVTFQHCEARGIPLVDLVPLATVPTAAPPSPLEVGTTFPLLCTIVVVGVNEGYQEVKKVIGGAGLRLQQEE